LDYNCVPPWPNIHPSFLSLFFFFFHSVVLGGWTQGLMLNRQALCHLNHSATTPL
jgi:hypothetical protein